MKIDDFLMEVYRYADEFKTDVAYYERRVREIASGHTTYNSQEACMLDLADNIRATYYRSFDFCVKLTNAINERERMLNKKGDTSCQRKSKAEQSDTLTKNTELQENSSSIGNG